MNEYNQQALEFLNSCPAEIEIHYAGKAKNHLWNDKKERNMYSFIIKTQRGTMNGIFWDSINNTNITSMTLDEYFQKKYKMHLKDGYLPEQIRAKKELDALKAYAKPNAYSILACLEKYPVGSMDDFMHEFGYEINCVQDMTNFISTYNAVVKEYNDLCRIFTTQQMEMLREIY